MNRTIALAALLAAGSAAAQEEVRWVHIESNPATVAVFEDIAAAYEAENPDVDVQISYLENEAFKARLPTMLQSNDAPHVFFSWGGGVLAEQMRGGVLRDLSPEMDEEWRAQLAPGPLEAFTIDGAVYGVPVRTSLVGIYTNEALFEEAGVDPEAIDSWSDLLDAVAAFREAGITPFAVGGAEGWPQHFFFSYLAMREAGNEALTAALNGEGEGFTDPAFVRAFEHLADLAELDPFQEGWLASLTDESYAVFGNGEAAMLLQGDWAQSLQAANSADGAGVEEMGWIPFPSVEGAEPDQGETLGGINGWLVFREAPDAAVDFLRFFTERENMVRLTTEGGWVTPVPGISQEIDDPWKEIVATGIEGSTYHQNFYNVMFAEEVNRELLDIVTSVMIGDRTPEEGAEALQESWEFSQ